MSLDFKLEYVDYDTGENANAYTASITHNLGKMAEEVGIYTFLWHPDSIGDLSAKDLIEPLKMGLELLKSNPDKYKEFDSPNGWCTYDDFVPFVEEVLKACKKYPNAKVRAWT